jgi:hypothetical protein
MSFGLFNAVDFRTANEVRPASPNEACMVYFQVVVIGWTFQNQLDHLREVFQGFDGFASTLIQKNTDCTRNYGA